MAVLVSLFWLGGPLVAFALLRVIGAPVLPSFGVLTGCVVVAPLASASLWIPLAAGVAGTIVGARWADEGSRLALMLSGRRTADVLRALAPLLGALALAGLAASTVVEPSVQRWTQRLWTQSQPELHLWPGTQVHVNDVVLHVDDVEPTRVWLQGVDWVASSPVASLQDSQLHLNGLEVLSVARTPARLKAGAAWIPLRRPVVRVPLSARGTLELMDVARRTAQAGSDAGYEWSVFYKRLWCGPVAAMWLALGWVLGALQRRWTGWAGCVVGWRLATLLGDAAVVVVGPLLGSLVGPLLLAVVLLAVARRDPLP